MACSIEEICVKLSAAVETAMNGSVDRQQRAAAYELCEEFKEKSSFCVQCGLHLAQNSASQFVRCFGLQLLEHAIKYHWNKFTVDEKVFVKDNALKLITTSTNHILVEPVYIKNGFAKIIVEMIKREWPQHWPNLMSEFYGLCEKGEMQTEVVLLTLLRLSEDAVTFQVIQTHRRREIYQTLVLQMDDIFKFLIRLLTHHESLFTGSLVNGTCDSDNQQGLGHCRVAQAVLETLTAFVEWVPINHLMSSDGALLQTLCLLLSKEELQVPAAKCLLQIVNRKGKVDERKPLLVLFNKSTMHVIFTAANSASNLPLKEERYVFLKLLCQVLIGLGNQILALWETLTGDDQLSENFRTFLHAILEFTRHPSQTLNRFTFTFWISVFRHEHISKDPVLLSFIPSLTETTRNKLIKVGYPSRRDSPSCSFSCLDFDSDEEFNCFFPKYRAELAEMLRMATVLNPTVTFTFGTKWLEEQLQKSIITGEGTEVGLCNLSSPSFLEWDALSVYLESVIGRIFQADKAKPFANEGIRLLKAVLNYETQDPLVLSASLSCISALFAFLTLSPEILPAVLRKIFSSLVFSLPGQTKGTRSRAVKNVRRHACSSLVKICKQYPELLKSSFDEIYMYMKQLSVDPEQLSQMEKCTVIEALILISNQFQDFNRQSQFMKEILEPISNAWLNQEMKQTFQSAEGFMSYIGLDRAPVEPSNEDVVGINRSQIIYSLNMMLAVMKRSKWPSNPEAAGKGGFFKEFVSNTPVACNPAAMHVLPLLENVLLLQRCFNQMWQPAAMEKISPDYTRAYEMLEIDKNNVLGINPPCVDMSDSPCMKQPLERMAHFLTIVHDNSYHILGNAGSSFGIEFYALPRLADYIIACVLDSIDLIPDYRLRPVIRVFMKPFVQCCRPEFYQTTVIPVLVQLCPYMFQRLNNKWLQLAQQFENRNLCEEDNPESQEVLEDQLNRQLTREYIDLLGTILHGKRTGTNEVSDAMEEDEHITTSPAMFDSKLSELGQLVLKHEVLRPAVIRCCFRALSWNDTTCCHKSVQLCHVVLKQLVQTGMLDQEEAKDVLFCVLIGLQQHGQHEHHQSLLLTLGLQAYEMLRPIHPSIVSVMLEIPECSSNVIDAFDEKLLQAAPNKQFPEKKKKEMFKNIVANIIGKNVGQLFKQEVHINNLPPLFRPSKPKTPALLDLNESTGLCKLFTNDRLANSLIL